MNIHHTWLAAVLVPLSLLSTGAATEARLQPQIINLMELETADMGPIVTGTLHARTLVATPEGSVSIQTGNAPRHSHQSSLEVQYVVSGTGTFWLGDEARHVKAGDLIIIPKGVTHGGSHADRGDLKMIAIKLPPAVNGDVQLVP